MKLSGRAGAGLRARTLAVFSLLCLVLSLGSVQAQPTDAGADVDMPGRVNINTADAGTIADVLDGVGESRARAIVDYRDEHGPFASVDELREVSGVGEATVSNNRERILLE